MSGELFLQVSKTLDAVSHRYCRYVIADQWVSIVDEVIAYIDLAFADPLCRESTIVMVSVRSPHPSHRMIESCG